MMKKFLAFLFVVSLLGSYFACVAMDEKAAEYREKQISSDKMKAEWMQKEYELRLVETIDFAEDNTRQLQQLFMRNKMEKHAEEIEVLIEVLSGKNDKNVLQEFLAKDIMVWRYILVDEKQLEKDPAWEVLKQNHEFVIERAQGLLEYKQKNNI